MYLIYLFDNKLRNVVNILFKLKNNDGIFYILVLLYFGVDLIFFGLFFVNCLEIFKMKLKKKKMWKKDVVMRFSIKVYVWV